MMEFFTGGVGGGPWLFQNAFSLLISCRPRNENLTLGTLLPGPLEPFPSLLEAISQAETRWLCPTEAVKGKPGHEPQKCPSPATSLPTTAPGVVFEGRGLDTGFSLNQGRGWVIG